MYKPEFSFLLSFCNCKSSVRKCDDLPSYNSALHRYDFHIYIYTFFYFSSYNFYLFFYFISIFFKELRHSVISLKNVSSFFMLAISNPGVSPSSFFFYYYHFFCTSIITSIPIKYYYKYTKYTSYYT